MSPFESRVAHFGQLSSFGGLSLRLVTLIAVMSLAAGVLEGFVLVVLVDAATGALRDGEDGGVAVAIESLQSPEAAVVAAIIVVALNVTSAYLTARAASGVTETVRDRVLGAFFSARWERQAEDSDGRLQEMIGALSQRTGNLTHASIIFLSSLIGATSIVLMAIAIDPLPALIIVAIGALIAVALRPAARRTKPAARRMHTTSVGLTEDVSQASQAAMEYAVFGVTDAAVARLRETTSRVRRHHLSTRFWARTSANAFKDAVIVAAAIAATIFAALSPEQLATVGAISLLLVRALGYAQQVQMSGQAIAEESAALEITHDYEASLVAAADVGRSQVPVPPPSIVVESVGFSYPGTERPALANVSFEVPAGAVAGIVGPSGAGKSTFIELLMGLREPTTGRILVAGAEPHRALRGPWAKTVGYVSQRPRLFVGTVRENVRFYRAWVSDDDVVDAAEQAHVAEEIRASPSGYDTTINTRGMGFSGGQAQRIALARALAGRPSLLVLDEPTSALDAASEERIATTLEELRGRVTVLIVSHRPSTLANCDLFVSLDDGRATVHDSLPTGPAP